MKKVKRVLSVFLSLIMLTVMFVSSKNVYAAQDGKSITILFTHDIHNHLLPFNIEMAGITKEIGGYARLKGAIEKEKKIKPEAITIDGGDFSMGTLFQSIYTTDSPDLRIMGEMGYDATTLGNHEFDFRANGLAQSLEAAKNSGDKLPQIVASNISFPEGKDGKLTQSLSNLKQAFNIYGVKDYTIIERNGVKIGIFGLMGKDAASNAPMAEVEFTDAVENAKRVVNILKQKENADIIICLSHLGISKIKSESEDEILAEKVPEINVIISGHSHTKLNEPIISGKTIIGSCGEYGENLGVINLMQNSDRSWKLEDYNLKQIDSSLSEDNHIAKMINDFKNVVQEKYLDKFDLKFDQVLASSSFNFVPTSNIGLKHEEDTLGNLISDSYIYAVKKAEGSNYEPVAAAIEPSGTIRGSFVKGNITVADAFTVSSLGVGADGISGYPLISVYLTGKELKTACEVDASITPIMSSAQLYMSGISFKFNPNRLIFNKVTDSKLQNPDGTYEKIDDAKLYRVIVGLYSAQMLSVVGEKSFGLLSIVPKTRNGEPITDFEAQIIKDTANGSNTEIKEWYAIAEYLKSFDKVNGIPQIPEYYNQTHDRKVVDNNKDIIAVIKNPNKIALGLYALILFVILIITLVIRAVIKIRHRRINHIKYHK